MKVDMSPQAVTNRMIALDGLWEMAIALRSSRIEEDLTPDHANKDSETENYTQDE